MLSNSAAPLHTFRWQTALQLTHYFRPHKFHKTHGTSVEYVVVSRKTSTGLSLAAQPLDLCGPLASDLCVEEGVRGGFLCTYNTTPVSFCACVLRPAYGIGSIDSSWQTSREFYAHQTPAMQCGGSMVNLVPGTKIYAMHISGAGSCFLDLYSAVPRKHFKSMTMYFKVDQLVFSMCNFVAEERSLSAFHLLKVPDCFLGEDLSGEFDTCSKTQSKLIAAKSFSL